MNGPFLRLSGVLGVTFVCAGCGSGDTRAPGPSSSLHVGGQTGGEAGIQCTSDVAVTPLPFDAPSALGFSAADVAAALAAPLARPLAWTDGTSAVLDLGLTFTTDAGYAASCRSNAADVTLSLASSDGALADSVEGRLFSPALDRGTLDVTLASDALAGALATAHPTLVANASGISVHVEFEGKTASGRVTALGGEGDAEIAAF